MASSERKRKIIDAPTWRYRETLRRCTHYLLTEQNVLCVAQALITFMFSKEYITHEQTLCINRIENNRDMLEKLLSYLTDSGHDINIKAAFEDLSEKISEYTNIPDISGKLTETLQEMSKLSPQAEETSYQKLKRIRGNFLHVSLFEIGQTIDEFVTDFDTWDHERSMRKEGPGISDQVMPTHDDTDYDEHNTPLIDAASKDDYTKLVDILSQSPLQTDINATNEKGQTAIITACRKASAMFVRKLLKTSQVDICKRDKSGTTALMYSAERGDVEIIDALLDYDQRSAYICDHYGLTYEWYFLGCDVLKDFTLKVKVHNNREEVEKFIQDKIHGINQKQNNANWEKIGNVLKCVLASDRPFTENVQPWINYATLLLGMVLLGNEHIVSQLLESDKFEINCRDAAHVILNAITGNNPNIIQVLCDCPKIPFEDIETKSVNAVLEYASGHHDNIMRRLMLQVTKGRNVSKALKIAMALHAMDTSGLSILLDNYDTSSLNTTDHNGDTAFMKLCQYGTYETLAELLKHPNINLSIKNHEQKTAFNISFLNQSKDVPNLILQHSLAQIDINERDHKGNTNLMCASIYGNYASVKTLLSDSRTDINARNNCGDTALILACMGGLSDLDMSVVINQIHEGEETKINGKYYADYTQVVKLFLQNDKVEKDATNYDRNNALMFACVSGNHEIVCLLLDAGVTTINSINRIGMTPCMIASVCGREADVTKLLDIGKIDLNAKTTKDDIWAHLHQARKQKQRVAKQGVGKHDETLFKIIKDMNILMCACLGRNNSIVSKLLDLGVDVNEKDSNGQTALMQLCVRGGEGIVATLLKVPNIDVNLTDHQGHSALYLACVYDNYAIVEMLLNIPNIDMNVKNQYGVTPFMAACVTGCNDAVSKFLDMGVDVNEEDSRGMTALMILSKMGRERTLAILLSNPNIDVNHKDKCGRSALLYACADGKHAVIQQLLDNPNIDVNVTDRYGTTALMVACLGGCESAISTFLAIGMDVNAQDAFGHTALIYLCKSANNTNLSKLLEVENIDINMKDVEGQSALFNACADGRNTNVHALLARPEIDINATNNNGVTILMAACRGGCVEIVSTLLEMGMDDRINETDTRGRTSLFIACEFGTHRVVEKLLEISDLDVNMLDKNGQSALMASSELNNDAILTKLVEMSKVDVNVQNKCGESILMKMCWKGKDNIVAKILEHTEVKVNLQDEKGCTALMEACQWGEDSTVTLLLQRSEIDVNIIDQDGNSALMKACDFHFIHRDTTVENLLCVPNLDVHINKRPMRPQYAYLSNFQLN